jgi:hypothetical protein
MAAKGVAGCCWVWKLQILYGSSICTISKMVNSYPVSLLPLPVTPLCPCSLLHPFSVPQVKTTSFLMFLLRQQPELMRPHTQVIADSLVHLLKTCPDAVTARKELLVATRHMMSTSFRDVFRSKLDDVLDARVFVGSGRACAESLRPLGYTILAELVHHTRKTLTPTQLSKVCTGSLCIRGWG